MDLKIYQREMWITIKKYLNLVSSKRERLNEKSMDKKYLELVKEVIAINEKQKLLLSTMRQKNNPTEQEQLSSTSSSSFATASTSSTTTQSTATSPFSQPQRTSPTSEFSPLPTSTSPFDLTETSTLSPTSDALSAEGDILADPVDDSFDATSALNLRRDDTLGSDEDYQLNLFNLGDSQIRDSCQKEESIDSYSNILDAGPLRYDKSPAASPLRVPSPPRRDNIEDIHDLVTSYEFMQSLGLLTIRECEEVLKKRQERHKKNAFSHIFCQSFWEKRETKRKKRDWLLSSSPPQLRRKIRPGSRPPSRQPSRPSSPLEAGSSSPPSSLSPPSPISPPNFNPSLQSSEEICALCNEKGASFQCDGCGVLYHSTCVDCPEDEAEWLCSKCETLGMRMTTYSDPLNQKLKKGVGRRTAKESGLYDS